LSAGDGVDHEVDLAPFFLQDIEHGVDRRGVGDVAVTQQKSAKLLCQRFDPLLQRIALPGERDFRTRVVACLGNAPGDRAVVGDAEDHPALALHQT